MRFPKFIHGRAGLLRRRRHQRQRLPQRAQHGRDQEGPGGVPLPEQRLGHQRPAGVADRLRDHRPEGHRYGIHGERVDGNDLLAVYGATRRARARAAAGEGPTMLECVTYRMEGHSTSDDPRVYRPPELLEPWRKRDPILRLGLFLRRRGALDDGAEREEQAWAQEEVRRALAEAESFDAKPPLETLFEGVYAEPLWQQREQLQEIRDAVAADPRVSAPHRGSG